MITKNHIGPHAYAMANPRRHGNGDHNIKKADKVNTRWTVRANKYPHPFLTFLDDWDEAVKFADEYVAPLSVRDKKKVKAPTLREQIATKVAKDLQDSSGGDLGDIHDILYEAAMEAMELLLPKDRNKHRYTPKGGKPS